MPARTATIPRSDSRRRLLVAVGSFLLISLLVIRTSDAAFTATHTNPDNEFATASIDLDSVTGIPLFGTGGSASVVDATNLVGAETVKACIDIDYSGSLVAADLDEVDLTISGPENDLSDGLSVTVERLDACGGTVQGTVASGALYSVDDLSTGWTPSGDGASRGFEFTVEVDEDDALQGQSLNDVILTWSVQTN